MLLPLSGKKILFIAPKTFGYENAIVQALERFGAEVKFHGQLPSDHALTKAAFRIFPKLMWKYSDRYFFSWLDSSCSNAFDIVFVVKGEGLSPSFLKHLRNRYPSASLILHLWDSIRNCKHIQQKLKYFDVFSSFDPLDCRDFPIFRYRPLFYLHKYLNREGTPLGQGIFFIGTLNGDRPKVIAKLIKSWSIRDKFNYWIYVRSKVEFILRKLLDKSLSKIDSSRLIYKPMNADSIKEKFDNSAAILDIEHKKQSGLTMRTFEVLASGKKLITTNKTIRTHDFYDPSRVLIIDRDLPIISEDFMRSSFSPLPDDFFINYSLENWIIDVFNL